jgi:hypothetical protein
MELHRRERVADPESDVDSEDYVEDESSVSLESGITAEDYVMMLSGLLGLLLAMGAGVAILMAKDDLDRSFVMAAGMVVLLIMALWISFCGGSKSALDDDSINPRHVFAIALGFGLLLGGLFGDLFRRLPPGTSFVPQLY